MTPQLWLLSLTCISCVLDEVSRSTRGVEELFVRMVTPDGNVKFDLYTRREPSTPSLIFARDKSSIEQSTFDPGKPTKFIIHGFWSRQGPNTGGYLIMQAFLALQDCNVITVDWHAVDTLRYTDTVLSTVPKVAAEIAELMRLLHSFGLKLDDIHIVGHSLGAQIAGFAASQVLGPVGKGRVTGLDPAGPMFVGTDPNMRLDPTDAGFVEVLHTDGGLLGYNAPTGHADFFPDGGRHTLPGCGKDLVGMCSHCCAYRLYASALLNPQNNQYAKCSSWKNFQEGKCKEGEKAVLGININPNTKGLFYLALSPSAIPTALKEIGKKGVMGAFEIADVGSRLEC